MSETQQSISVSAAAHALGLSTRQVRRLVEVGILAAARVGPLGWLRITKKSLNELLRSFRKR